MRGPSLSAIIALVVIILLAMQLDLTAAAANHYLVLHPCLFPTHMRVVFSVTKELVKVGETLQYNSQHAQHKTRFILSTERPSRDDHSARH